MKKLTKFEHDLAVVGRGKTKQVIASRRYPYEVDVISSDDITAGDGAKRSIIDGKSILATTTTCNCFELLSRAGVSTHYIGKVDERTFRARTLKMIPIELVARRVATGSYLKRNPEISEGTIFDEPVIEFFYKNDAEHDPLMIVDFVGNRILYFNPKQPMATGFIREKKMGSAEREYLLDNFQQLIAYTKLTFEILERAWAKQDVTLVDLKIECGHDLEHPDSILVGDVIDNDSWRIWPKGKKEEMKDKQVYRNAEHADAPLLGEIKNNYAWVAEATAKFLEAP